MAKQRKLVTDLIAIIRKAPKKHFKDVEGDTLKDKVLEIESQMLDIDLSDDEGN